MSPTFAPSQYRWISTLMTLMQRIYADFFLIFLLISENLSDPCHLWGEFKMGAQWNCCLPARAEWNSGLGAYGRRTACAVPLSTMYL